MGDLSEWWTSVATEPRFFGAAIGALTVGFVMFLMKETWEHRKLREKSRTEVLQDRLDTVYGPLYAYYREAYVRFELWKSENPSSLIERQAFFSAKSDDSFSADILATKASSASQGLIVRWAALQAASSPVEKSRRRAVFVSNLIKEYQSLRRELRLDYDKQELRLGEFAAID